MIKKIATLAAYRKAPRTTFLLKHPIKGAKLWLGFRGAKAAVKGRAGLLLGALAAIPLGVWATSRFTS